MADAACPPAAVCPGSMPPSRSTDGWRRPSQTAVAWLAKRTGGKGRRAPGRRLRHEWGRPQKQQHAHGAEGWSGAPGDGDGSALCMALLAAAAGRRRPRASPVYMPPDETNTTRAPGAARSAGSSRADSARPPSVLVAKERSSPSTDAARPLSSTPALLTSAWRGRPDARKRSAKPGRGGWRSPGERGLWARLGRRSPPAAHSACLGPPSMCVWCVHHPIRRA
jgi:hypothetical protein